MKALRAVAVLVLIAGICLTCRALYLHAKAELAGILIRRAWKQSLETGQPHAPWPWADTHPIARLQIPRLGYDEMVLEDASPRNLAFGPARLLSGAQMGESGNLILAGHRTSWFKPLEGIAQDDTVELEWFDSHRQLHRRTYSVSMIQVVDPQDIALLTPTSREVLTLITCYPFGRSPYSPQRFIVRALPMEDNRAAANDNSVE